MPGGNTGDAILSNSIFGNGNLGINLGPGSNQGQVPPVLASAFFSAGITTIAGTFDTAPDTTYTLQFFATPVGDPSGSGQGQTLLGTAVVTTDDAGHAAFSLAFATADTSGQSISATATDPSGNTSAFARNVICATGAPASPSTASAKSVARAGILSVSSPRLPGRLDDAALDELAAEMAAWERDSVAGTRSPLMARGRR